jgi:hypothetical protein
LFSKRIVVVVVIGEHAKKLLLLSFESMLKRKLFSDKKKISLLDDNKG